MQFKSQCRPQPAQCHSATAKLATHLAELFVKSLCGEEERCTAGIVLGVHTGPTLQQAQGYLLSGPEHTVSHSDHKIGLHVYVCTP